MTSNKIVKFVTWWFDETLRTQHGIWLFFLWILIPRTIILMNFNIDGLTLDGLVFPIFLMITIAGPQMKEDILNNEKRRK